MAEMELLPVYWKIEVAVASRGLLSSDFCCRCGQQFQVTFTQLTVCPGSLPSPTSLSLGRSPLRPPPCIAWESWEKFLPPEATQDGSHRIAASARPSLYGQLCCRSSEEPVGLSLAAQSRDQPSTPPSTDFSSLPSFTLLGPSFPLFDFEKGVHFSRQTEESAF